MLRKDEDLEKRRRFFRNDDLNNSADPVIAKAKLLKNVLNLIARGQMGRARRRIVGHGMASLDE